MTDEKKTTLRDRILGYLAEHPDSTTSEIASGIGADWWDVQHAVCFMELNGQVSQVGRRETNLRPIYRVTTAGMREVERCLEQTSRTTNGSH